MRLSIVVLISTRLARYLLTLSFDAFWSLRFHVITKIWGAGCSEIRSFAINVIFIFKFELLIRLVSFRLDLFKFSLKFKSDCNFILNFTSAAISSEEICPSDVKEWILLNLFLEEGVINVRNYVLALYFFKTLGNLLAKSVPFLFLAHFFVNFSHIFMGPLFLSFFCHSQNFAITFSYMFNKASSITNQSTFNCVDQWACLLIEAITATSLCNSYKKITDDLLHLRILTIQISVWW